jgi:hypothetical protein
VPFDQIRLAPDGLQDIIDIMGDAARELAESDHPIGMRRLRLHPIALSNFFLNLRFGQERPAPAWHPISRRTARRGLSPSVSF